MTRYAIDAAVALRLIREDCDADRRHQLVGPSVLRSHALSMLYRAVRNGQITEAMGRQQLGRLAAMKIRLLGDRVSRARAWKIAAELGLEDIAMVHALRKAAGPDSVSGVVYVESGTLELSLVNLPMSSRGIRCVDRATRWLTFRYAQRGVRVSCLG